MSRVLIDISHKFIIFCILCLGIKLKSPIKGFVGCLTNDIKYFKSAKKNTLQKKNLLNDTISKGSKATKIFLDIKSN